MDGLEGERISTQISGEMTVAIADSILKDATGKDTKEITYTVDQTTTRTIRQIESK